MLNHTFKIRGYQCDDNINDAMHVYQLIVPHGIASDKDNASRGGHENVTILSRQCHSRNLVTIP